MTPRNETPEDLKNERQVADVLEKVWKCKLRKITEDRLYLADFAVIDNDGQVIAFIEVRCRSCSSNTYKTLFVPLQKVTWATSVFTASAVPYFYVVNFLKDGVIAYRPLTHLEAPLRVTWVERHTEVETHPSGPVAELSMQDFKIVARREEADVVF
jgi:hypothetical protein